MVENDASLFPQDINELGEPRATQNRIIRENQKTTTHREAQSEVRPIWFYFTEKPRSTNAKHQDGYRKRIWCSAVETASDHEWPFKRDEKVFTRIYYLHRARRDTDVDNLSKPILDAISRKTNPAASPSILEDDNNVVWRLAVKINLTEDQYELPGDPVKVAELIEDETLQDIVVVEVGYVTSSIKITVGGGIES